MRAASGDLARVEPEPVHAAQVARVLDLHAAVHHDLQAARSAISAPSGLITPNCSQSAPAPIATASSAIAGTASGRRKTSTTSIGTGTSASYA